MWLLTVASWITSWWMPHGTYVTGFNRYGVRCERGFLQLRYGERRDLRFENHSQYKIVPIAYGTPFSDATGSAPRPVDWGTRGPYLTFVGLKPVQKAEFLRGGFIEAKGASKFFGERVTVWAVPYWLIGLLLSPAVVWVIVLPWRERKSRRRAMGLCEDCGYDLRASPEQCPECGAIRSG
jgi:hypothetical protein